MQGKEGAWEIGFYPGNGCGTRKALGLREAPPEKDQIVFLVLALYITTHHSSEGSTGLVRTKEGEEAEVGKLLKNYPCR